MKKYFLFFLVVYILGLAAPAYALYYSGGDGIGFGFQEYTNGNLFTLSSASDQTFVFNDGITAISAITVTQDSAANVITTASDIRITIPSGMNMIWNTADTDALFSGTALAKVAADYKVTYEDDGKTLVVNVITDFVNGDSITVSGLSFQTFTAASQALTLGLEVDNAGTIIARDYNVKVILLSELSGIFAGGDGSGFGYYPGPWRGKVNGIANPAKINGISVWKIRSISGVTTY